MHAGHIIEVLCHEDRSSSERMGIEGGSLVPPFQGGWGWGWTAYLVLKRQAIQISPFQGGIPEPPPSRMGQTRHSRRAPSRIPGLALLLQITVDLFLGASPAGTAKQPGQEITKRVGRLRGRSGTRTITSAGPSRTSSGSWRLTV